MLKENDRKNLKLGDHVRDIYGDEGIVVKIKKGSDSNEHGTIAVWLMSKTEYGADNCEHYPEFEWWKTLTILSKTNSEDVSFKRKNWKQESPKHQLVGVNQNILGFLENMQDDPGRYLNNPIAFKTAIASMRNSAVQISELGRWMKEEW